MSARYYVSCLAVALTILAPAGLLAEESEDDAGGEESEDDDESTSTEEDAWGDEDEFAPQMRAAEEEEWTFDGVVEPEPEEAPAEEVSSTRPEQEALPAEPSRNGVSGNWYEVPISCATCATLLGQSFEVEVSDVMRRYFEHLVIDSNRRGGKFVYPTRGENRPVSVQASGRRVLVAMFTQEPNRRRSTNNFAQVWDLEWGPDDEILYGRRYRVETSSESAYEIQGEGYRASEEFLSARRLFQTSDLAPVQNLDLENSLFAFTEDATIVFVGRMALVRSDYNGEGVALRQAELQAEADAAAELLRQQEEAKRGGDRAYEGQDLEGAIAKYLEAIELGLDADVDMRFNLGAAYQQLAQYDQAVEQYRWLLEQNPRDTDVRFNLGRVLERLGEYADALEQYEAIVKYDPNDIDAEDRVIQLRRRLEN